jgi:hypothetical protein
MRKDERRYVQRVSTASYSREIMRKARKNPLGKYLPDVIPVVVGKGQYVHIFHPLKRTHICHSGKNAGKAPVAGNPDERSTRQPVYYRSSAKNITCWRCLKLAHMNVQQGRAPWQGPYDG